MKKNWQDFTIQYPSNSTRGSLKAQSFFGLLVVVATGYGYVLSDVRLDKLFAPATLLALAATLWASWYLAALGYAFRFLQNCQHCIEHELGWAKFTPGSKHHVGEPPNPIKSVGDVFWLLPGIYHAHAVGLCVLLALICIAGCRTAWAWWPHCCVVMSGLLVFSVGIVFTFWINVHYVRKFRDSRRKDPAQFHPKHDLLGDHSG
jgi:hypothetical protein